MSTARVTAGSTGGTIVVRATNSAGAYSEATCVVTVSSNDFAHGASYTITGSGFGTKPIAAPLVWDDCTGSNPLDKWTQAYPYGNAITTANMAYRAVPFTRSIGTGASSVAHPHSRGTAIAAGAATSGALSNLWNIGLSKSLTKPGSDFVTLARWWERVDDQWTSDTNFKLFGWGVGTDIYGGSSYWYIDYNPDGGINLAAGDQYETNDDSTPIILLPQHEYGSSGGSANAWLLRTVIVRHAANPNGRIYLYEGDSDTSKLTSTTQTLDNYAGTARSMWIGTYQQTRTDNSWRYFADLFMDVGEGWFYLTNNADWASSTVRELQPWTSWSDSSVTVTINAGRLSGGVVHLHYRKAPWGTGHQYIGSRLLA